MKGSALKFLKTFLSVALCIVMLCTSVFADTANPKTNVPGDVNDDGFVNLKDLVVLAQVEAGWTDVAYNPYTADVNGDGEINLDDVTYLARHLAGWEDSQSPVASNYKFAVINDIANKSFLFRVGNKNAFPVGKLFTALEGSEIGNVTVSVEAVDEGTEITGAFTANNSDWSASTLKIDGAGLAKITIQDDNHCIPTELIVEVVDAVNAISATSATGNNVVLLSDCGFGSLEVSGGHTLYGNGFKLTCGSDSYALDRTYSFVELKDGTLDNVQIIVPNFSHAIMYESNKTEDGNPSHTDSAGKTRYYNIRSAVVVSANSTITNSYISGGRTAIYATSGILNIKNSTICGGAVANIQTETNSNLVLEDVTLIQKPITATVNDTSKTIMGLSVVNMCDTEGKGAAITLKGYLHQYAWANADYKQYVPSEAQSVVDEVLAKTNYIHSITYSDGATKDSVNLGFVNMPNGLTTTEKENITTDSFDFESSYGWETVSSVTSIYTYNNTNGTADAVKTEPTYSSNSQGNVLPNLSYSDVNENRIFTTTYDATNHYWKSTLKVDVDAGEYNFSFDKLLAQKYGKNLEYTVKTETGATVDKTIAITLNSATSNVYVLTITDDQIYDKNGNKVGTTTHTYVFELLSTKTSLPAPTWTSTTLNGTPYIVVSSKGGDWNCAVPVLDGLKVKYWSKKQNKEIELDLATVVSAAGLSAGLQNGSNNTITITVADEYTLTVTTTGFKTNDNGKPVVVNGKLYFTVSSSGNFVSTNTTNRTPSISYTFTDANNSDSISLSSSFNVVYADHSSTQYKYDDFCNGTLKEATSGCVTADTLITLADGTQKRIDELTYEDELLVWNFYEGKYDVAPVAIIFDHGADINTVIKLNFSDGTSIKVVNLHQFFNIDLNKLVTIDETTVDNYIGHKFAKNNAGKTDLVKLTSYSVTEEYVEAWGVMSAEHYNIITEGIISTDFELKDINLFNYFEIGDNMQFDTSKMQADIEKYGLYTYSDFADYLTYEQFIAFNVQYFKIPVGKGLYTYEGILELIDQYLN